MDNPDIPTEIATRDKSDPIPVRMTMQDMAHVFHSSGLCKTSSPAQIVVKMQIGAELGLQPFQSINAIDIIEGRPVLKPLLLAALIRRSRRYDYRIVSMSNTAVSVEFVSLSPEGKKVVLGVIQWDTSDMTRAGLQTKDNWKKYPRNMMFHRCIADGARFYCPDIYYSPIYIPDEMGMDTDENGEVVADWHEIKKQVTPPERTDTQRRRYAAVKSSLAKEQRLALEKAALDWSVSNEKFDDMLAAAESEAGHVAEEKQ